MNILDQLVRESREHSAKAKAQSAQAKAQAAKAAKIAKERAKFAPVAVALEDKSFESQYQTVQIILQECDECASVTRFVGAISLHQQHKRDKTLWREVNAPLTSALAVKIRYHNQRVPMCACCLNVSARIDEIFSAEATTSPQLALF